MPFSITPKNAPDKVPGVLSKADDVRSKAMKAFMGQDPGVQVSAASAQEAAPQAPNPADLPTSPTMTGGMPPSTHPADKNFEALTQRYKAEQEADSTQSTQVDGSTQVSPPAKVQEVTQAQEGKTEQSLSPRYAALARQEKALRARDAAIKAEKARFEAERAAYEATKSVQQSQFVSKERLRKEALAVLQEEGIDYNMLSQQALNAPDPETVARDTEMNGLKAEIAELKGLVEQGQKAFKDSQTESYQQAVAMIGQDVQRTVSTDPAYAVINATGSQRDVVDLIEKTFHEGLDADHPKGTLMTVDEACQIVEDYLIGEAEKLAKLEKIQARLKPATAPQTPPQQVQSQQLQPRATLTNGMTGAPKTEYSSKQRAVFAAQYGPNWREKVGNKA